MSVKVTIQTDHHHHAGKPCVRGEVIEVSAAQAAWLEAHKIAKPATKADAAKQEG